MTQHECMTCHSPLRVFGENALPCASCNFSDDRIYLAKLNNGQVFARLVKNGTKLWEEVEVYIKSKVDGSNYNTKTGQRIE